MNGKHDDSHNNPISNEEFNKYKKKYKLIFWINFSIFISIILAIYLILTIINTSKNLLYLKYSDMNKTSIISSDGECYGTIYLPKEWSLDNSGDWINIKDSSNNQIIGQQFFTGYLEEKMIKKPDEYIYVWEDLNINPNFNTIDIENSCFHSVYKSEYAYLNSNGNLYEFLVVDSIFSFKNNYRDKKFQISILFNKEYCDLKVLKKITNSYRPNRMVI